MQSNPNIPELDMKDFTPPQAPTPEDVEALGRLLQGQGHKRGTPDDLLRRLPDPLLARHYEVKGFGKNLTYHEAYDAVMNAETYKINGAGQHLLRPGGKGRIRALNSIHAQFLRDEVARRARVGASKQEILKAFGLVDNEPS